MVRQRRRVMRILGGVALLAVCIAGFIQRDAFLEVLYVWDLDSADEKVRLSAAEWLAERGTARCARPLFDVWVEERAPGKLLSDNAYGVALAQLGDEALEPMSQVVGEQRASALDVIDGMVVSASKSRVLMAAIEKAADEAGVLLFAEKLAGLGESDTTIVQRVLRLAKSKQAAHRLAMYCLLRSPGFPRELAVECAVSGLNDPDVRVIEEAASALTLLAQPDDSEISPKVLERLEVLSQKESTRDSALLALESLR